MSLWVISIILTKCPSLCFLTWIPFCVKLTWYLLILSISIFLKHLSCPFLFHFWMDLFWVCLLYTAKSWIFKCDLIRKSILFKGWVILITFIHITDIFSMNSMSLLFLSNIKVLHYIVCFVCFWHLFFFWCLGWFLVVLSVNKYMLIYWP